MDKNLDVYKIEVKRRKLFKAVVRKIPAFMSAKQFHSGFTEKLEIKYHSFDFKQPLFNA